MPSPALASLYCGVLDLLIYLENAKGERKVVSSKKFITVLSTVGLSAATTYSLPVAAQTHEEDELQEIVVTSGSVSYTHLTLPTKA